MVGEQVEGKLVKWDRARGFGFVRVPGIGLDCFLHYHDVVNGPVAEDGKLDPHHESRVRGRLVVTEKGPRLEGAEVL